MLVLNFHLYAAALHEAIALRSGGLCFWSESESSFKTISTQGSVDLARE